jgi:hypothetical protein
VVRRVRVGRGGRERMGGEGAGRIGKWGGRVGEGPKAEARVSGEREERKRVGGLEEMREKEGKGGEGGGGGGKGKMVVRFFVGCRFLL